MTKKSLTNSNITSNIIIGSSEAVGLYCIQQNHQVSGIVTCQLNSTNAVAQLQAGINSQTGCEYATTDPFEHTTYCVKDNTYDNKTYTLTSAASHEFNQTVVNSLKGNEWATACTAFFIKETGNQFCIIVHPNELTLINFCKINNWNYKMLNN